MIERLESRRMLAAATGTVEYDADSTSVKVMGTDGNDIVTIIRRDDRLIVTLNGEKHTFKRKKITWVDVQALDGDDVIDATYTAIPLVGRGGNGRDTIVGGWGNDSLHGGNQADRIVGNAGNDSISGSGGRDVVFGGDGDDTLNGDTFGDRVFGDAGNDDITDFNQVDIVDGGADADWMTSWDLRDEPRHASIEGRTLLHTEKHADPVVHLQAIKRKDGQFAIVIAATHPSGGYDRNFGALTRNKRTFYADVSGSGDGLGIAVVISEPHTYILGRLADGTYTFNAGNDQRQLASMTIQISDGNLVNTWTTPTPATPLVIPFEP